MTVPDYTLERYRLGELSPGERQAVEAALDDADRARLATLDDDDDDILARYPARVMAMQIDARRRSARRRTWAPVLGTGLVLAGAVAAVLIAVNLPPANPTDPFAGVDTSLDGVRIKGPPRLLVFDQHAPTTPLADDAPVTAGDTVQVKLNTGAAGTWAVLFSVDGNGVVTRHLSSKDGSAVEVQPGQTVPLDSAYTLDDAPEFERFFLVVGDEAFAAEPVEAAVRALAIRPDAATADLEISDLHVVDHLLRKVTP